MKKETSCYCNKCTSSRKDWHKILLDNFDNLDNIYINDIPYKDIDKKKITQNNNIKYICKNLNCTNIHEKNLQNLIKTGALCKNCCINKVNYYDILINNIELDNIICINNININNVDKNKISATSCIKYVCSNVDCNNIYQKTLRGIQTHKALCRSCIIKNRTIKTKQTLLNNLDKTDNIDEISDEVLLYFTKRAKYDNIDLSWYTDNFKNIDKFNLLFEICKKFKSKWSKIEYKLYFEKYYNDNLFNILYINYNNNKNKWFKPSIDHVNPIILGGDNKLDNLQLMTWFENKSKGRKTNKQWHLIKKTIFELDIFNNSLIKLPPDLKSINKLSPKKHLIINLARGINKKRKECENYNIDYKWYEQFDDINKIKLLNIMRKRIIMTENTYKNYILKFYNDDYFNKLYILWKNGYDYLKPSLDHNIPLSKGGKNDLDNIILMSWIENYMKTNIENWNIFKKNINILLNNS